MKINEQLDPIVFAIFGGRGDLTYRKLVPALFDLSLDKSLPRNFSILVIGRAECSEENLRRHFHEGVKKFSSRGTAKTGNWSEFAQHIHYQQGDLLKPATYVALGKQCAKLEEEWGSKTRRVFYMATPPNMFGEIPKYLGQAGLARDREWAQIVVEKPIGYNLQSARALNTTLLDHFEESQIFRIDHYLGKETVQNILAFRFANPLFEPIWNRRYVDYVTITAVEELGVEHRGGYYDHAGALRDMVQNHLIQLLCLVAMEPMISFDADEIRNKKADVMHAMRPIHPDSVIQCVVRGQYGPGWINGKRVPGYREEEGVAPDSQTETFVALKLYLDNWRWQDVPFYLRTGKRLARQATEISIQFKSVPHQSFPADASLDWQPSRMVMSIQPDEGIVLRFQAKRPGPKIHLQSVEMKFNYEEAFAMRSPDAYETLLWDIMKNDATLFMRADQVEAAWKFLTPVIDAWSVMPPAGFPNYAAGTWGPEDTQGLLAKGHNWSLPIELVRYSSKK
jgi:glucose-6-phosphate 1-dehydrogenase